jgi:hypothetical protein
MLAASAAVTIGPCSMKAQRRRDAPACVAAAITCAVDSCPDDSIVPGFPPGLMKTFSEN